MHVVECVKRRNRATQQAISDNLGVPLKVVRRNAITILIFQEGNGSPTMVTKRPVYEAEHLTVAQINTKILPISLLD